MAKEYLDFQGLQNYDTLLKAWIRLNGGNASSSHSYPKVRWARHGRIDLTNCNNIDYILVPCKKRCQILFVTNQYLKDLASVTNLVPIFENSINNQLNYWVGLSHYFQSDDRVIDLEDLDKSKLPVKESLLDSDSYVYTKEWVSLHDCDYTVMTEELSWKIENGLYPNFDLEFESCSEKPWKKWYDRIVFEKDINGFHQYIYKASWGIHSDDSYISRLNKPFALEANTSFLTTYKNLNIKWETARLVGIPNIILVNPFKGKYGGVIPIIDGKLRLDLAREAKNKKFELVSTNEIIEFDRDGLCKTPLRPSTYLIWTHIPKKYTTELGLYGYEIHNRNVPWMNNKNEPIYPTINTSNFRKGILCLYWFYKSLISYKGLDRRVVINPRCRKYISAPVKRRVNDPITGKSVGKGKLKQSPKLWTRHREWGSSLKMISQWYSYPRKGRASSSLEDQTRNAGSIKYTSYLHNGRIGGGIIAYVSKYMQGYKDPFSVFIVNKYSTFPAKIRFCPSHDIYKILNLKDNTLLYMTDYLAHY